MSRFSNAAIGIGLWLSTSACGSYNKKDAYLSTQGQSAVLEIHGMRRYMAHDPVSAVVGGRYEDSASFRLPYCQNCVVQGADVRYNDGEAHYRLTGYVKISQAQRQAVVNLQAVNTDDNTLEPVSWNGVYRLRAGK
jgi:hypothetical protein